MKLAGKHIKQAFKNGSWKAFRDDKQISVDELTINTNSVNASLGGYILVSKILAMDGYINLHRPESLEWAEYSMPYTGYKLDVGKLILGNTRERFDCTAPIMLNDGRWHYFAPMIEGRSTPGRCGLSIHQTAGFGDYGFNSSWTLEISTLLPITFYHKDELAQVYFDEVSDGSMKYQGAYTDQHDKPKAPVLGKDRFARWK